MVSDDVAVRPLFEHLRRLVVEQPLEARMTIAQLLDEPPTNLGELLGLIGLPGEGRLRHAVANAVIEKSARAAAVPQLAYWHSIETDEFTKRALRKALNGVVTASTERAVTASDTLAQRNFFEAYRVVQRQLAHRVRNALRAPNTTLRRFRRLANNAKNVELQSELLQLSDELENRFSQVGRLVEFNTGDNHFVWRLILVYDWLIGFKSDYVRDEASIGLEISADSVTRRLCVRATPHLMHTIFWNLVTNAHQAVGENCRVTIRMALQGRLLRLVVVDNGSGLPKEAREAAFIQRYASPSNQYGNSGVGLLEVRCAAEELRGSVDKIELDGRWFVMVELPWEAA